jgi:SAM-dependent methyltransferase
MATDAHAAADFYGTRHGALAARLLRERLAGLWPSLAGQSVLGIGYATPYLRLWREAAARCIALTPAQIGAARWPAGSANLSCTAEEDALPFPDLCFDRILLVHGLEASENARRLLREVWRVLKDDGRLLVVAPNRSGLWAHVESTPFGQGQPYSPGQIGRLLAAAMFRIERRDTALYLPPTRRRLAQRGARLWESTGRRYVPRLAGVLITEAAKDLYAAVPVKPAPRRRRLVLADAG